MELLRGTVEDWGISREIRLRALADAPEAFCSTLEEELAFDDQVWRDRLNRGGTFFVRDGGSLVGTATGKPDPHEEGGREIVAMWVDPAVRRSGVAVSLIDAVAGWACAEGAPAIALWVADDNVNARRLYEKCGFVLTGEHEPMRPNVDQLRMRKTLNSEDH